MNLTAQLILVADKYGEATSLSRARVSTLALNQGMRLEQYAAGSLSPSVKVLERTMKWFSSNWPEGAKWPEGIARPAAATPGLAEPPSEAVGALS